jgi:hypothetical protein
MEQALDAGISQSTDYVNTKEPLSYARPICVKASSMDVED